MALTKVSAIERAIDQIRASIAALQANERELLALLPEKDTKPVKPAPLFDPRSVRRKR